MMRSEPDVLAGLGGQYRTIGHAYSKFWAETDVSEAHTIGAL